MSFCTAINCMDGRTQLPVNDYLRKRLNVKYVDTITEAGPVRILGDEPDSSLATGILDRLDISTNKHGSTCIAVVAHHDCGGNPASKEIQMGQLDRAVRFLAARYPHLRILGLWLDAHWTVSEPVPSPA
jgi:carbonic anhydrase